MKHAKSKYQLNRFTSWRKATVISMVKNLLIHETIITIRVRAKAARALAEKMITLAKQDTLAARRRAFKVLGDHQLVSRLFKELGPRFKSRTGGYTRILNLGKRRGDDAQEVIFQLTEIKKKAPKKVKEEKGKKPLKQEVEQAEIIEKEPEKEALEQEKEKKTATAVKEHPPTVKKPAKKFFGGLRNIFKKERDSL